MAPSRCTVFFVRRPSAVTERSLTRMRWSNGCLRYIEQIDDPTMPGEMQATISMVKVACGTELRVVQEGIPPQIPVECCHLGWQESLALLAHVVEPEIPDAGFPIYAFRPLRIRARTVVVGRACARRPALRATRRALPHYSSTPGRDQPASDDRT